MGTRMLTDVHKTKRMGATLEHFMCFNGERNTFFWKRLPVVTKHEKNTWFYHVERDYCNQTKNNEMGAYWFPKAKNFKFSARKVKCIVCWEFGGILLMQFRAQGTTINAESYREKVTEYDIKHKAWPIEFRVVLLHDNTLQHVPRMMQKLLVISLGNNLYIPLQSGHSTKLQLFMQFKKFIDCQNFISRNNESKESV